MGFFKEEGVDVLDLTLLKKKGILKIKEDTTPEVIDLSKTDRDGFAPLTNTGVAPSLINDAISAINSNSSSNPSSSPTGGTTFASFWDAPVRASPSSTSSFDNNTAINSVSGDSGGIEVKNLGVKVEDVEYKLERLSEKLLSLEEKINEVMRRV